MIVAIVFALIFAVLGIKAPYDSGQKFYLTLAGIWSAAAVVIGSLS